jgi:methylthioribose-1-phosphate isomerase
MFQSTFIPVSWSADIKPHGAVRLLDQTLLPQSVRYVELTEWRNVVEAIRDMTVRGAPAIGCTAALGLALAAQQIQHHPVFLPELERIGDVFKAARPTAVNLMWAIDRMLNVARQNTKEGLPPAQIAARLIREGRSIIEEDITVNRRLGRFGAESLPTVVDRPLKVLTHCNAGALATAGYGTALGVVRAAIEMGRSVEVWADETRPRLQGLKLTVWELQQDEIPVTAIADNMAAVLMREGQVDCIVVGADRIAANGDTANKIGTYGLAVQAQFHKVPFYVAAPLSTVDFNCADGSKIPIEERADVEITQVGGSPVAPVGARVWNPAFDVTPAALITAIFTERGVARTPLADSLNNLRNR